MQITTGMIIEVNHPFFPITYEYKVIRTDVVGDGRGTIELSTLKGCVNGDTPKIYKEGENTMVVEKNWFDEKLTKRKIKIINYENDACWRAEEFESQLRIFEC